MPSPPHLNVNKSSRETNLQLRTVNDGGVLLDLEHDRLLTLNPVGVEIWKLLRAGESEPLIAHQIAQRYGIDQERVACDVRALLVRITDLQIPMGSSVSTNQPRPIPEQEKQPSYPWYGQDPTATRPKPKTTTVCFALVGLAIFDLILSIFSLKSLCTCVKKWPVREYANAGADAIGRACGAVDRATVWYPKKALCLQRSAVTTCLLRSHGIPARMSLGVRPMPFMAHAWVEVEGSVVNDLPRVKSFYGSLTSY
jgi:hypothetical protein